LNFNPLCNLIPALPLVMTMQTHIFGLAHSLPYWQRGRGCVSSKTHWLSVWLRKKNYSLCMGPTMNCVRNAGNLKAKKCCFFARLFENNHATLFQQCSMIHWLNSVSCLHCSLNSGACEQCELHCSREIPLFFFFFSVC